MAEARRGDLGFRGVCMTQVENGLLLTFQWTRDPNTYAIRFSLPGTPGDEGGVLPADSSESWAQEQALWLMEKLDTGFCARARRC